MAITTITRNLKLRISSDLTEDSKFNLNKLDSLGSIYQTDTNQLAKVRSQTDILLQTQDPDIGGSGSGGTINIGSSDQPADTINLNATNINLSTAINFSDQATGGTRSLLLQYKSDLNGATDTAANRSLRFDLEGADRDVILGGNFQIDNNLTFTAAGAVSLTLPVSGTVSTITGTETLTNKTIDTATNTISNLTNSNISASAAIDGSKLVPVFGAQEISTSSGIKFINGIYGITLQPPTLSNDLTFKLPTGDGSAGQVLGTDGAGNLSFISVATASLPEANIFIGNSSNQQTATDTAVLGDIQATTVSGLQIKAQAIFNADINNNAAIALSKLAAFGTVSRVAISGASGELTTLDTVTTTELGHLDGVTSAIQTQIDGKQSLDATLTSLAAYNTNGMIVQTAADTFTGRTLTAGSGKISVVNGNGISGNPTIDIGTLTAGDIPNLDTSKITTGTFVDARIAQSNVTQHEAAINHDALTSFIADEHVAHSSIDITAGTGLTGGGTIDASRVLTLALDELAVITTPASNDYIPITDTSDSNANRRILFSNFEANLNHDSLTGFVTNEHLDWTADLGGSVVHDSNISSSSVTQHSGSTFLANWTQADGATKVINHALGTQDIAVELYDTADGATIMIDSVVRTDTNNLTLTGVNLPGTFNYRVLIREIK